MKNFSNYFLRVRWRLLISTLAMAGLEAACVSLPQAPKVDLVNVSDLPPPTLPMPAPLINNGSLFQQASYRPGFEERRARLIGDVLTIQIIENISASQKSSSTVDRSTSNQSAITAAPLLPSSLTGKLGIGATSENTFEGKGGNESANKFEGIITTTVAQVLPNGHLVVVGEKQIGVNQYVDALRFSGTVDPSVIQPGNIVYSTQVANARIQSRGRGALDEAQTTGWLTRFFSTYSPF